MPYFSVVLRKVFGVAGAAFVDNRIPNMRVAWPSGDWGSLPLEGGIYVSFSESGDPLKGSMHVMTDRIKNSSSFTLGCLQT